MCTIQWLISDLAVHSTDAVPVQLLVACRMQPALAKALDRESAVGLDVAFCDVALCNDVRQKVAVVAVLQAHRDVNKSVSTLAELPDCLSNLLHNVGHDYGHII